MTNLINQNKALADCLTGQKQWLAVRLVESDWLYKGLADCPKRSGRMASC